MASSSPNCRENISLPLYTEPGHPCQVRKREEGRGGRRRKEEKERGGGGGGFFVMVGTVQS